jgi:hypothetical protein
MARSQSYDDQDPLEQQAGEISKSAAEEAMSAPEDAASDTLNAEEPTVLPTLDDLESQGFTPEQVRGLIVVSDRAADSSESRAAEAEMRRLRFTRWLIDHGVLDEWTA